jgi:transposase
VHPTRDSGYGEKHHLEDHAAIIEDVDFTTAHGLDRTVVNPRQVRDSARAAGQLAKTDALDARILALFAERMQPEARAIPDAQARALTELVTAGGS